LGFIPINKPILGEEEKEAVRGVLDSGMLTNASYKGGPKVQEFERKLARLLKVKHAVAVNSGTAALHTALAAAGVGPGDEVVVPSFTFLATANVVLALGAKPVFVDNKEDYNMDPGKLKKAMTRKTKAVIPVHLYGYPADMDEINEVARSRSAVVVEDAAESLGAEYNGTQTGAIGDIGCFSMYATKVVTSGEGGAITTKDDELADKLRLVRNHGQVHGYDSRMLGYNYRMQEIPAAIASVQMDRLQGFLRKRRRNAKYLSERVLKRKWVKLTQTSPDRTHVWYLYTLYLERGRDKILKKLNNEGIGAAVYFKTPVHLTPLYSKLGYSRKKLEGAVRASKKVISLPVHPAVEVDDCARIATSFDAAAAAFD
jgi:perosamine synthetase